MYLAPIPLVHGNTSAFRSDEGLVIGFVATPTISVETVHCVASQYHFPTLLETVDAAIAEFVAVFPELLRFQDVNVEYPPVCNGFSVAKLFVGLSAIWSVTAMPEGVQWFFATCHVPSMGAESSPRPAMVAQEEKSIRKPPVP